MKQLVKFQSGLQASLASQRLVEIATAKFVPEFSLIASATHRSGSSLELINGDWILSESPFQILTTAAYDPSSNLAQYSFKKSIKKTTYGHVMDFLQNPLTEFGASMAIGACMLIYGATGASSMGVGYMVLAPLVLALDTWIGIASTKLQSRCDYNSRMISTFCGPEFTIASAIKQALEADLSVYDDHTNHLLHCAASNFCAYADNAIKQFSEPMNTDAHPELLGDAMTGTLPAKLQPLDFVGYQEAYNGFLRDIVLIKLSKGLLGQTPNLELKQKELMEKLKLGFIDVSNEAYKQGLKLDYDVLDGFSAVVTERIALQRVSTTPSLGTATTSRRFYTSLLPQKVANDMSVFIVPELKRAQQPQEILLTPCINDLTSVLFKYVPHIEKAEQITEIEAKSLIGWIDTELEHATNDKIDAMIAELKKMENQELANELIAYLEGERYEPLVKMKIVVEQTVGYSMLIKQPMLVPNGTKDTVLHSASLNAGDVLELDGRALTVSASFGKQGGMAGGIKALSTAPFSVAIGPRTENAVKLNGLDASVVKLIGRHLGDRTSFGELLRWLYFSERLFECDTTLLTSLLAQEDEKPGSLGCTLDYTLIRAGDNDETAEITIVSRLASLCPSFSVALDTHKMYMDLTVDERGPDAEFVYVLRHRCVGVSTAFVGVKAFGILLDMKPAYVVDYTQPQTVNYALNRVGSLFIPEYFSESFYKVLNSQRSYYGYVTQNPSDGNDYN